MHTDFEITFVNDASEIVQVVTIQAEDDWQACLKGWEMLPEGATDFQLVLR